jgi:hypothetical protein
MSMVASPLNQHNRASACPVPTEATRRSSISTPHSRAKIAGTSDHYLSVGVAVWDNPHT